MAEVPDDVSEAILSKLPIKSLLRFSCACKTWYSVISDPQFCKKMTIGQPRVLICENLRDFLTVTVESLLTEDMATAAPLPCPWDTAAEPDDRYVSCLGSCHGLICLDRRNDRRVGRSGLILCNPSTRKFRTLPRPSGYMEHHWWNFAWFGYDESIDDYKIVWVNFRDLRRRYTRRLAEVDVFTLKSNTWRTQAVDHIKVVRERDDVCAGGVLCNNAIHWITFYGSAARILVFDLATEKFRVLQYSDSLLTSSIWLGSLDGERLWLCEHVYQRGGYYGGGYRGFLVSTLWVMKEYDVESSWTKVVSIGQGYGYRYGRHFNDAVRMYPILLCSTEMEGKEMMLICNFSNKKSGRVMKLRVEEGKIKVKKKEDILLGVAKNPFTSISMLPIVESLLSIN